MYFLLSKLLDYKLPIIILFIFITGFGVISMQSLHTEAFPDISPNLVQVFTVTSGLAPEDVENYVTFPIERVMSGLPGIKKVRSVSNFGLSVLNLYFEDNVNIYFARQLVQERLTEAKEAVPEGIGDPKLGPISSGMGLILFYYLKDELEQHSLIDLRTIQDWKIKPRLLTVKGVAEVLGIGGYEKQYHVILKYNELLRYHVTVNDVLEQIEANNLNVGGGFITKNDEEYVIKSDGLIRTIPDIENILIKSVEGLPILLRHLAEVKEGGAIRRGIQKPSEKFPKIWNFSTIKTVIP